MKEKESALSESIPEQPVFLKHPQSGVHLIATADELSIAVDKLSDSKGPVAIDAERASGFKYSQRAYLLQIKAEHSDIYLIDPTSDPTLISSPAFGKLRELLSSREWILHAATQDIPCLQELGLRPNSIFDTELAGRLASQPRVGLGSLVESLLNFGLAKEHSAADWSTRPLPESWLNYAALDVELLHQLRSKLQALLEEQGKAEWARQEFEHLLSFKPKTPKIDRWRGITGLSKVTDQGSLEIARQLWQAREELAIKMDVSPGRLVPDAAILAAAQAKPKTKPELSSLRSFTGRASRSYLDHWWQAVNSANKASVLPALKAEKNDGIPNHRNWASKFPDADRRLRHARNAISALSEKLSIPIENILTPDVLRQICFAPPEPVTVDSISAVLQNFGVRPWQIEQTAEPIAESISRLDEPDPKPQIPRQ